MERPNTLQLDTVRHGKILSVRVRGKIDGASVRTFHALIEKSAKLTRGGLILNFRDLEYISSTGLRSILLHAKGLAAQAQTLAFVVQH